jgi:short-subunit dehydrogenase
MNFLLNGKRVLITGASKGIGYATALSFAREGAKPIMVARNLEMLEKAASIIFDDTGVKAELICLDLTSSGSAVNLFESVGPVDILVNNAGSIPGGPSAWQGWRTGCVPDGAAGDIGSGRTAQER